MSNTSPTYPNPTITEAVCDIHFRLSSSSDWKPSSPGELFRRIYDEYPEMEPILEMGLQFELGPQGTGTKVAPQRQRVRFKHKNRPLVLQLAEDSMSLSTLAPYQGWQVMQNDVLNAWQNVENVVQPELITRVGLRYINRIQKTDEQEKPYSWLKANDYIPDGILRSDIGFLLRVETHLNKENVLIITLGDTKPDKDAQFGTIIFDIDRIIEGDIVPQHLFLRQEIERLHSAVWDIFSSARSKKLEDFLQGE